MSPWFVALIAGIVIALVQYGVRDLGAPLTALAALLRVAAVALVVALVLDAPAARATPVTTWGALDVSQSMLRGDSIAWRAARDSLGRAQGLAGR